MPEAVQWPGLLSVTDEGAREPGGFQFDRSLKQKALTVRAGLLGRTELKFTESLSILPRLSEVNYFVPLASFSCLSLIMLLACAFRSLALETSASRAEVSASKSAFSRYIKFK